jgi:NTE family protein
MSARGKVCVVLGGGGARGLAHLGVLQVIEREGIPIDCIVGTSVGAIVGACYALEPDALSKTRQALAYFRSAAFSSNAFKKLLLKSDDVEQNVFQSLFSSIRRSYVFSNLLRRPSILPGEKLAALVNDLVPDRTFADTKLPFAVPALDIRSGEDVVLTEGPLRTAVLASCSLPGFFPPVAYDRYLLADAGVIGPVPIDAAVRNFSPDVVIAVDISSYLERLDTVERGIDVILRVESIACARLNAVEIEQADVVIRPAVGDKYWSDFSDLESMVNEGVVAAQAKVAEMRAALERKKTGVASFFRRFAAAGSGGGARRDG